MQRSSWKARVTALVAATGLVLTVPAAASPVSAAPAKASDQCVIYTDGVDENGNLIIVGEECFSTLAQSLRAAGAKDVPNDVSIADGTARAFVAAADGIIGVHYDATSQSGASLTVNGSNCSGGGLNVSLTWNDRISSTLNGCPTVIHYENTNYAGSSVATYGVGSWTSIGSSYMNNRTSSIKYF